MAKKVTVYECVLYKWWCESCGAYNAVENCPEIDGTLYCDSCGERHEAETIESMEI